MMRNILILIFALGLMFIISCNKEDDDNNNEPVVTPTEIEVGETENMLINYYDTTLIGEYNTLGTIKLDVDNDGNNDILLTSILWGSPEIGDHPRTTINCLNDQTELYGFNTNDTSFLNVHIKIVNGPGSSVEVHERHSYTCHRIDESDSVLQITPAFKILPLDRGDILKLSDTFSSDSIVLTDDWYRTQQIVTGVSGDTTFYEYEVYYNDCNSFSSDEVKYIGIRMNDESKLGWLRINISEKYKILILESAIQE